MPTLIDWLDDLILGPLNLIDRFEGWSRLATRHNTQGNLAPDTGVRFYLQRMDKTPPDQPTAYRPSVRRLLHHYGIATFGIQHDSTTLSFLVPSRQATFTHYLLQRYHIPYHT